MFTTGQVIDLTGFFAPPSGGASGAMASFLGIVRNHSEGRAVLRLEYECYVPMAEKVLKDIRERALKRWPLQQVRILHRFGKLEVGEAAVAIAVSAARRDEAFRACRFLIEEIKHKAPIWKKEVFE